jgi:membrane associated rhomboid family serine protease
MDQQAGEQYAHQEDTPLLHDEAPQYLADSQNDSQRQDDLVQLKQSLDIEEDTVEEHQQPQEFPELPTYPVIMIYVLMITNVIMFLFEMYLADWQFAPTSQNPMIGPSGLVLLHAGAKDTNLIVNSHEYWRLVSPMFLHAGICHLFVNMMALRNVGSVIEAQYGGFKVWIIYVVSGISGSVLSALFLPHQIGIGASGAIFGLVGANYADLFHLWKFLDDRWSQLFSLLLPTIVGLLIGLLPMMDNFAHIGGLVCGILSATCMLGYRRLERLRGPTYLVVKRVVRILSFVLLVLWFFSLSTAVFSGKDGSQVCKICKYAGCFDTQWWTCPGSQCQIQYSNGTIVSVDWKYCQQ